MRKIAIFVTSVYMVKFFLLPHLKLLARHYDVTLIVNNDAPDIFKNLDLPVRIINIPIMREISIWRDFTVLLQAVKLFRKEKFDLVHTITPKAGLIGIIAAFFTFVPNRVHTFQGEVWANKTGLKRVLLRFLDRTVCALATNITVVSHGEREFLISEKIISVSKSQVIGPGSIGGVDLQKFKRNSIAGKKIRNSCSLDNRDIVFLYVGRMNFDKGLPTLVDAFANLVKRGVRQPIKLLLVGPDEGHMEEYFRVKYSALVNRHIHFFPYTDTPQSYMSAADILVLPSLREGFGVVVIEAAANGIPAIVSNIYGLQDAVIDQETGLIFEVESSTDLEQKMMSISADKKYRVELGKNAKERVERKFDQKVVLDAFLKFYRREIFKSE